MAMELRNYTEDFAEAGTNGWHDNLRDYTVENLSNKGEKIPGRSSFSIKFFERLFFRLESTKNKKRRNRHCIG